MRYRDIAVIGISGKFASATNVREYRQLLIDKKSAIRSPEGERLDLMKMAHDAEYMKCGYIKDIDKFDNEFFDITNREARLMSPEQRLSLEMVAEAIQDAGYSLKSFRGSNCGVFVAAGESEYNNFIEKQSSTSIIGSQSFMLSGQIGYHFDLRGENVSISSGCSSALMAIHDACEKLTLGEIDTAIVGGVILYVDVPKAKSNMYDTLGIMSPDYTIRSFGEGANGTVCGEGGGYILLKNLETAEKDGDHIYGVILSGASNGDGGMCTSVSMPSVEQQQNVVLRAWESVDMEQLTEIEAHGIGAPVGDAVEIESLNAALKTKSLDKKPIKLSTVKANTGHLFSQSGMASIIKVMLGYQYHETYPIAGLKTLNPLIKFDETSLEPQREVYHWKDGTRRMTGMSSFGLSGCNTHLIVRNYIADACDEKPSSLLKISARTEEAFYRMKKEILQSLGEDFEKTGNLIYTLNAGRDDYEYRAMVPVRNMTDLKNKLETVEPAKPSEENKNVKVIYVVKTEKNDSDMLPETSFEGALPGLRYREITGIKDIDQKLALYEKLQSTGIRSNTLLVDKIFAAAVKLKDGKISKEDFDDVVRTTEIDEDYEKFKEQIRIKNNGKHLIIVDFTRAKAMACFDTENQIEVYGVETPEDIENLIISWYEAGRDIDFAGYYSGASYKRVPAPLYPFERKHHWIEVKERSSANVGSVDGPLTKVTVNAGNSGLTGAVTTKSHSMNDSWEEPMPSAYQTSLLSDDETFLPEKKLFVIKSEIIPQVDIETYPYSDAEYRSVFAPVTYDTDANYKIGMLKYLENKNVVPDAILLDKNGRSILNYVKNRMSEKRLNECIDMTNDADYGKTVAVIEDYAKSHAVTVFDFGQGKLKAHKWTGHVRVIDLSDETALRTYLANPEMKISSVSLPVIDPEHYQTESPAAAETDNETDTAAAQEKSAEIISAEDFLERAWLKAFNLDGKIGHDEDFFSLGGNSLIMQSMSDEINEHFHMKFDIFEIYDYETIEKLAVKILEAC